jgi:O-antigen ligase
MIPLVFIQFRRSDRGHLVFAGFVLSCVVLLLWSFALTYWPGSPLHFSRDFGVPVRNAASQSGEFTTCIFGLLFLAYEATARRQWLLLLGFAAVILGMLANILFVATGRTALIVIIVLIVLFAARTLSLRGIVFLFVGAGVVAAVAWATSPYLRDRTAAVWRDIQEYEAADQRNSTSERIEFAKHSIEFIIRAPIIGHGTGSIDDLFARSTIGKTGAAGSATTNPHNQTFAVAIQLGIVGAAVLWAMWIAHLLLFRGTGLAEWVGLLIIVQNIVGSLFNSHLFDFLQGWVYVLGVGVAGGMVLKRRTEKPPAP